MTPCARGCCWVPMPGVCAKARDCPCHWEDKRPARVSGGAAGVHRDPTANEAIANVMREGKK